VSEVKESMKVASVILPNARVLFVKLLTFEDRAIEDQLIWALK
jgi:hypothetical protein